MRNASERNICGSKVLSVVFAVSLFGFTQTQKPAELPSPGLIADVVCASDATESYALYLPSTYTQSKRWPIIYFFDPAGRGRPPPDLYKMLPKLTVSSSPVPTTRAISRAI